MASAAILGATGGMALAQTSPVSNPNQGQFIGPYGAGPAANNNLNNWGVANNPSGSSAAGPLSTLYAPNTLAVPTPGNVVIRLNGRIEADIAANWGTGQTAFIGGGSYKVNPISIGQFMRLYPGFDGISANGLRYGASIELRQNYASGTWAGPPNGSTAPSTSAVAASPSSSSSGSTVFVRRAFTYLASDQVGIVRLGMGDGVLGLFDPCIFVSGCWDAGSGNLGGGNIQTYGVQAGQAILFPFLETQGAEYTNSKIVYLSPQFFGFDFGLQYAPSMANGLAVGGNGVTCLQASSQCINLSSGSDPTRWLNQVGVGLRYMHNFGAVDFKTYGFYETAGKENQTAGASLATTRWNGKFDNLNFYKGGIAVTAFNITAAIDYIGGAINNQLAMRPSGGANMNAFIVGLTYANGPITAGINFENIQDQGSNALTNISQRHQYATSMGGAYRLAPGLQLIAEYNYQYRHQGGFDFTTGASTSATSPVATRDAQTQTFMVGTVLSL
jgi:hypothetical protein